MVECHSADLGSATDGWIGVETIHLLSLGFFFVVESFYPLLSRAMVGISRPVRVQTTDLQHSACIINVQRERDVVTTLPLLLFRKIRDRGRTCRRLYPVGFALVNADAQSSGIQDYPGGNYSLRAAR